MKERSKRSYNRMDSRPIHQTGSTGSTRPGNFIPTWLSITCLHNISTCMKQALRSFRISPPKSSACQPRMHSAAVHHPSYSWQITRHLLVAYFCLALSTRKKSFHPPIARLQMKPHITASSAHPDWTVMADSPLTSPSPS